MFRAVPQGGGRAVVSGENEQAGHGHSQRRETSRRTLPRPFEEVLHGGEEDPEVSSCYEGPRTWIR